MQGVIIETRCALRISAVSLGESPINFFAPQPLGFDVTVIYFLTREMPCVTTATITTPRSPARMVARVSFLIPGMT